jgi:phage major head subunit gpT-like protein
MGKSKKKAFSITRAIKANARERLGTPPKSFPLPTTKEKAAAKPKHKETLADLLSSAKEDQR